MYKSGGAQQTLKDRREAGRTPNNNTSNNSSTLPKQSTLRGQSASLLPGKAGQYSDILRTVKLEGLISVESSTTVLDIYEIFSDDISAHYEIDPEVGDRRLSRVFALLTCLLGHNQSEKTLLSIFVSLKLFIFKVMKFCHPKIRDY